MLELEYGQLKIHVARTQAILDAHPDRDRLASGVVSATPGVSPLPAVTRAGGGQPFHAGAGVENVSVVQDG